VIVAIAALVPAAVARTDARKRAEVPVAVLAYLDGRDDLAAESRRRLEALASLSLAAPIAVCVAQDQAPPRAVFRGSDRRLKQLSLPAATGTGDRERLVSFLQVAVNRCPPGSVCVWLRGHGLPPLAGIQGRGHYRLLIGADDGLTAADAAEALRVGLGDRPRGPLVLETCFGASLETCWELAPVASHLVALYGLAAQPGLDWNALLTADDGMVENWRPAGASVYDLGQMVDVKRAFGEWCQLILEDSDLADFARAAQWARQQAGPVPLWQSCDLGTLVGAVAAGASDAAIRSSCHRLLAAIDRLVLWPPTGSRQEETPARGVAIFLPPLPGAQVGAYATQSQLARESGYGELLQRYVKYGEGLLPVVGG
jgi:hypothetical protein